MSIKRTKQASQGRNRDPEGESPFMSDKPKEPEKTWAEQTEGKGDDAFAPYSLAAKFDKGSLVAHPKFGKGVVTKVEGARVEVLFEDGMKKLGHAG